MQTTQPTTRTLEVPGASLTYDVRPGSGDDIPLFLIGLPMGAAGFGSLASHFPDRAIITYDPRGSERSTKADPSTESNTDQHADDLHRIIQEVGGLVDLFASSGGAATKLREVLIRRGLNAFWACEEGARRPGQGRLAPPRFTIGATISLTSSFPSPVRTDF